MKVSKKYNLGAALAVLLVSSWQANTAFAEATYSDQAVVPHGNKKQVDAAAVEPQINQADVATQNARLGPDVEVVTEDMEELGSFRIRNVSVQGNKTVPLSAIEKKILTRAGNPLSADMVAGDIRAILSMGWFEDVRVTLKELPNDPYQVDVIYEIIENPVYQRVEVSGNTKIETEEIVKQLKLKPGELANTVIINAELENVVEAYHKAGFAAARVREVTLSESGVLNIQFDEGVVEKITLHGNKKNKDYVLMREMRFKPGDAFNVNDAQRSLQRLDNLGYFVSTDMHLKPGEENPNEIEVEVGVVEDSTITVGAGVGYSESERFFGTVSIEEASLFGTGDSIGLQWEVGAKSKSNYYFTYKHPWVDDKETKLGLSLYGHTHEYGEYDRHGHEIGRYDKKSNGQELTFTRADSEFTWNEVKFKRRDDEYVEPRSGYARQYYEDSYDETYFKKYGVHTTAKERRKENFGETRSVTFSRVLDTRDSVIFPRTGKRTTYSLEQAGFGGDFTFTKLYGENRYYFPLGKNVLAVELAAGNAWGDLPLSQRFALGGLSLRGYEEDQFMGNSMVKATAEYRFPLSDKVTTLLFVDGGYAWDKRDEDRFDFTRLRYGYGVGLRFKTPIGPARLDYGFGHHNQGHFHFGFGNQF